MANHQDSTTETPNSSAVNSAFIEGTKRYPDVFRVLQPNQVVQSSLYNNAVIFLAANGVKLKVEAINDHIFRFRYAPNGIFERPFSYALTDEITAKETPQLRHHRSETYISTSELDLYVSNTDLRLKIYSKAGQLISEDAAPFYHRSTIMKGTTAVRISKKVAPQECFFGLGDKTCNLNLRNQKLQNWNTDAFGYSATTDPLYRTIPFYYGLVDGIAYGIFLHNSHRSYFDFDSARNGEMYFSAEGGEMDYFFISGPKLDDVARRYMQLTGVPELPPLWALGFHQCRWSYYPAERVKELAQEFRDRQIPCDAIYLDIDYMDGYRCFTWDKELFPEPTQVIAELEELGFHTIVMIDPGIKVDEDYEVYKDGIKKNMFCRRFSGDLMVGPVWPQSCVFPDYTSPEVREWWQGLYHDLYMTNGVSGFWNDMNEPAVFQVERMTFPDAVVHNMDGQPSDHARAHNIYGMLMSRATHEGLKRLKPEKRPFLLTRATFSGGQRYAAVWTGDNYATWEHLRIANIQCQRLSISGFSFVGTDIGGFAKQPDGELLVRWIQMGVFHPFFRIHSMGNNADGASEVNEQAIKMAELVDRMDQEPWSFGEPFTTHARKAIELRYQLLPYLYTAMWKSIKQGTPVLKSLVFYDQTDSNTYEREQEFMFGEHLLVCPIQEPGIKVQPLYLPKGEWYDFLSGERYQGNQTHRLNVMEDAIPVFVKAGAVIPLYPVQQFVGELEISMVTLKVYYGEGRSNFYFDQGEGYGYKNGEFSLRVFETKIEKDKFIIKQEFEGDFKSKISKFKIEVWGLPGTPKNISGHQSEVAVSQLENKIELFASEGFRELQFSF